MILIVVFCIFKINWLSVCCIQRFGSGSVPTHLVGATLLRGEWRKAVEMLLDPREGDILLYVSMCTGDNVLFKSF